MDKYDSVPGFTKTFESVRRLAIFHKIDQVDCRSIAVEAAFTHPGDISAATRAARKALNAERRQRLPGRPVDDRIDGSGDGREVFVDRRTLPEGLKLSQLNDDGEWMENEIADKVQACDLDHGEDVHELPKVPPRTLAGAIIFLSDHRFDVHEIADKTGVTKHRIRQILRDKDAIRKAVEDAATCQELPGFTCTPQDMGAPRKPIKHKPRGVAEDQDDQTRFLFEEEEELV